MTCDWICNKIMSCLDRREREREREREHPEASRVCLLTHVSWDHPWALIFSLKPCLLSKTISSWFLLAMQRITWTEVPIYRLLYGSADCPHELNCSNPWGRQYMIFTTVQNIQMKFCERSGLLSRTMVLSGHIYGVKSCWWLPSKELLSGIPVPIIFLCCSSCNCGRLDVWGTFCLWHDKGKSISSDAQYATLQKYCSHPSLVIYFFCNPTHKTEWDSK
jgi:hypothetical protein